MLKPIRVLMANRPRLMRELLLTTFSDQPDIEIVDEVPDESDIPAGVEKTHPDFVVITQDSLTEQPGVCETVLRRYPHTRIIAIVPHHNFSIFYWASMDICSRKVEASEEAILGILRNESNTVGGLT